MRRCEACLRARGLTGGKGCPRSLVWLLGSGPGVERGFTVCSRAILYVYTGLLNVESKIQNIFKHVDNQMEEPLCSERAVGRKTG